MLFLLCLRRYLHDKALFEDVLKVVEKKPSAAWYIGGNAPAMANRLAKEGCEVLLGGRMSQKLRGQLQEGVKGKWLNLNIFSESQRIN